MTEDQKRPPRAENCRAQDARALVLCERCALAWDPTKDNPDCAPLTPTKLRAMLDRLVLRFESSHDATAHLAECDSRFSDPLPSLKAVAEVRALARFVDRVLANDQIVSILRKTPAKK